MSSPEGQLRAFANCAGRLTAQLEHQWLMQSEASDITQHQRSQIVDILHSIIPEDRGREVLSWRTDARAAQRALLNRAQFSKNPADAAWAATQAEVLLADCTSYLTS